MSRFQTDIDFTDEGIVIKPLNSSNRATQFIDIIPTVIGHIEGYTVPQYGDAPDDLLEKWELENCYKAMEKYIARFELGRRGRLETMRDLIKLIHFATVAYWKYMPTEAENETISKGEI